MSKNPNDLTPSLSPGKPKRSSLKGANMMDAKEIMKYAKKKRNSVSFQLGGNFQFNKLRTTFEEMKPKIINPLKKKSFVEKRKQSIKNEFALAKELLKKEKALDEIENETEEVKENTNKNLQVGKEIEESDSEDVSSDDDKKEEKKNEESKNEEKKNEKESKNEENQKENEKNNNDDDYLKAPDSNRGEKEALNEKKTLNSNCKFC